MLFKKKKGWEISMHGYSHLYERQTNKKDIFNYGGGSEFFGLDYENQLNKIKSGLEKFREKNISIRSFFAPNHTYDSNTLKALDKSGIRIVIDGYGLFPYSKFNLIFRGYFIFASYNYLNINFIFFCFIFIKYIRF